MVITTESGIAAWWATTYRTLAADLGFSPVADHAAAVLLQELLDARDGTQLDARDLRLDAPAVVVGAADTLQDDLTARPPADRECIVAADGAIAGLHEAGLRPDLIVSDLDGDLERLVTLNSEGTPVALHAHGDNVDQMRTWVPRLPGPILGTRQTPGPVPSRILTPGGLGDGDRAVFLASRLGASRIRLVGFDLHGAPGRLSHHTNLEQKRRKMAWSARILDDAHRLGLPLEESAGRGL